ncbi:MAG: sigma-70 family RNA polymerase sigma factor [Planctomycetes bacterium]|nr:sigma-70 family RNA polymerase sigma factor [Planctomycetota bacterium]
MCLLGLSESKLRCLGLLPRDLRRLLRLLPPRERYLLRLFYVRGASQRELAGLLGVDPRTVRRTLARARERALDPLNLAIVAAWRTLDADERRLACLHRLMGLPLGRIARMGLVPASARGGPPGKAADVADLRALFRRIRRKARRAERRRARQASREPSPAGEPVPDTAAPPEAASASAESAASAG